MVALCYHHVLVMRWQFLLWSPCCKDPHPWWFWQELFSGPKKNRVSPCSRSTLRLELLFAYPNPLRSSRPDAQFADSRVIQNVHALHAI